MTVKAMLCVWDNSTSLQHSSIQKSHNWFIEREQS